MRPALRAKKPFGPAYGTLSEQEFSGAFVKLLVSVDQNDQSAPNATDPYGSIAGTGGGLGLCIVQACLDPADVVSAAESSLATYPRME